MFTIRQYLCTLVLTFVVCFNSGLGQDDAKTTQERAAAARLDRYTSKHLTLYTDIRGNAAIKELPELFDQAVPQWAAFLDVPAERLANWRMTGFIMSDAMRFRDVGLIPNDLPEFLHAFQSGDQFWVHEQPSNYYRRHLVLHEGTHGVMTKLFGGAGPPWYMEGTAELLGTHQWDGKTLKLAVIPDSKEKFSYWGRLKIVRTAQQECDIPSMIEIMHYDSQAHLKVEPYAWCWALAVFLDHHTATRQSFRQFAQDGNDQTQKFSSRFYRKHRDRWVALEQQWHGFAADMEYGLSPELTIPRLRGSRPLEDQMVVVIVANHTWQATGVRLTAGQTVRIQSASRYQVGNTPSPWWCEPQGITIEYYRHRPLGMLLAALVDDSGAVKSDEQLPNKEQDISFLRPLAVGREIEWQAQRSGTLFLKVNESSASLDDNKGILKVTITNVH